MGTYRTLLVLLAGSAAFAQDWSPQSAGAYMDRRSEWWMGFPKAAKDHDTFCISCHTVAPIALGRPALREALKETSPSANEQKFRANVTKRVRLWREVEPFYPDQIRGLPKTSESRGTESILDALLLVWNDVPSGRLSPDARLALENMLALQFKVGDMSGSWAWLQFHNAPWEGDSQFYGSALAAIAIGSAPGNFQTEPAVQENVKLLRTWLVKNMDAQTPLDRVVLLWASSKLKGMLTLAQQSQILQETLAKQGEDGGFALSSLVGGWKRHDDTPLPTGSDGYATALIAYVMEQLEAPDARPHLKRALAWLAHNQQPDGRWASWSLNKNRELSSEAGLFMSDAATAYAVMALTGATGR